jgi:hypothetical protein
MCPACISAAAWLVLGSTSAGGALAGIAVKLGGEALHPTSTATTVRVRGGKISTTDGPSGECLSQSTQRVPSREDF